MKRLLFLLLLALPLVAEPQKRAIVEKVAQNFEEKFVDEKRGREIAAQLRKRAGELDGVAQGEPFAQALTQLIQSIEDDKHCNVRFGAGGRGSRPAFLDPEVARKNNFDFRRVRHLDGNVGYFEVTVLHPPQMAGKTVDALFQFLQHTDAMIIDLRGTRGGAQPMVNYISSYFLPADGRELLTSRFRGEEPRVSRVVDVPGKRFEKQPLYILIGEGTFSAGEALAYILQQEGRAKLVGTKTKGGGRHNTFVDLGDGYTLSISIGETTNPRSKKSWQGTGVIPDVVVKEGENPVDVAHALALKEIQG